MSETIKILIVDDTVTYRQIISNAVSAINGTEIIGVASNGKIALSKIELYKPDLVLLDISMPVMDGIETLRNLRSGFPDVDVIMVSGIDRGNANMTMRALSLGALDFIAKPQGASSEESLALLRKSLEPIINLVKTRKYSRRTRQLSTTEALKQEPGPVRDFRDFTRTPDISLKEREPVVQVERRAGKIEAVGIGVSTGGPSALQRVIPLLGENLDVPVFTVQHMPPTFTASLAERLDRDSKISVEEASDGAPVRPGKMYIAPGGQHLVVRGTRGHESLGIVDSPPVNSCRPSVDVLFRSMAMVYGGNILTVILTGMGKDGAAGVAAIRRKGGYCIVQDEATSVVWGMPQAVVEAQDADEILPVDRIARRIMDIVVGGRGK